MMARQKGSGPGKSVHKRATTREISAAQAAENLGLTAQSIGLWVNRSGAPARKDGRHVWVVWPDFARWREEQMKATAIAETQPTDREAALARKANAEAGSAELDYAERLGQLVTIEDSAAAVGRALDLVIGRLRAMGPRFSQFGPEVERAVEQEVESVIGELHGMDEDVLEYDEMEKAA